MIGLVATLHGRPLLERFIDGDVSMRSVARLLSLRWRIVTWLVVIELMLGQNLLGRFLAALQGPAT